MSQVSLPLQRQSEFESQQAHKHLKIECYDPAKSHITADAMSNWIKCELKGSIREVPGIGEANSAHLAVHEDNNHYAITTSFGLIGAFLTCYQAGEGSKEACDRFFHFLKDRGVKGVNTIVRAVAEKANISFPGVYDASVYTKSE